MAVNKNQEPTHKKARIPTIETKVMDSAGEKNIIGLRGYNFSSQIASKYGIVRDGRHLPVFVFLKMFKAKGKSRLGAQSGSGVIINSRELQYRLYLKALGFLKLLNLNQVTNISSLSPAVSELLKDQNLIPWAIKNPIYRPGLVGSLEPTRFFSDKKGATAVTVHNDVEVSHDRNRNEPASIETYRPTRNSPSQTPGGDPSLLTTPHGQGLKLHTLYKGETSVQKSVAGKPVIDGTPLHVARYFGNQSVRRYVVRKSAPEESGLVFKVKPPVDENLIETEAGAPLIPKTAPINFQKGIGFEGSEQTEKFYRPQAEGSSRINKTAPGNKSFTTVSAKLNSSSFGGHYLKIHDSQKSTPGIFERRINKLADDFSTILIRRYFINRSIHEEPGLVFTTGKQTRSRGRETKLETDSVITPEQVQSAKRNDPKQAEESKVSNQRFAKESYLSDQFIYGQEPFSVTKRAASSPYLLNLRPKMQVFNRRNIGDTGNNASASIYLLHNHFDGKFVPRPTLPGTIYQSQQFWLTGQTILNNRRLGGINEIKPRTAARIGFYTNSFEEPYEQVLMRTNENPASMAPPNASGSYPRGLQLDFPTNPDESTSPKAQPYKRALMRINENPTSIARSGAGGSYPKVARLDFHTKSGNYSGIGAINVIHRAGNFGSYLKPVSFMGRTTGEKDLPDLSYSQANDTNETGITIPNQQNVQHSKLTFLPRKDIRPLNESIVKPDNLKFSEISLLPKTRLQEDRINKVVETLRRNQFSQETQEFSQDLIHKKIQIFNQKQLRSSDSITAPGGLIHKKPFILSNDQASERKDTVIPTGGVSSPSQDRSSKEPVKELSARETRLITNQVLKVLEKKIISEKDRRGLF